MDFFAGFGGFEALNECVDQVVKFLFAEFVSFPCGDAGSIVLNDVISLGIHAV